MKKLSQTEFRNVWLGLFAVAIIIPVAATVKNPYGMASYVAFFVIVAMIIPAFEWIGEKLGLRPEPTALIIAVGITALYYGAGRTILPPIFQGAVESSGLLTAFSETAPDMFRKRFAGYASKEMIDQMLEFAKAHITSVISPGAAAAVGSVVMQMTVSTIASAISPYVALFAFAWWSWEYGWETAVRTFVPPAYAEVVLRWWQLFREKGTEVMKLIGLTSVGFVLIFTAMFVTLSLIGYPISMSKACFLGIVLGLTAAIPLIGGVINFVTMSIMGPAIFGFDLIIAWIFLIIAAVHVAEFYLVTPSVVSLKLGVSTICLGLGYVCGFSLWGPTKLGIATSLLTVLVFRTTQDVMNELLHPKEDVDALVMKDAA